jgi:hypothetical protein
VTGWLANEVSDGLVAAALDARRASIQRRAEQSRNR